MNTWQEAAVLLLILVLSLIHVDKYEMTPPLALTMLVSYLWLTFLLLRGVCNMIF